MKSLQATQVQTSLGLTCYLIDIVVRTEKKKENIPLSVLENYNDLKERLKILREQWRQCQGKKEEVYKLGLSVMHGRGRGWARGTAVGCLLVCEVRERGLQRAKSQRYRMHGTTF